MNALEKYRTTQKLTYEELANKVGGTKATLHRHCLAVVIPGEAALRYNKTLDIPLHALRPDIYDDKRPKSKNEAT